MDIKTGIDLIILKIVLMAMAIIIVWTLFYSVLDRTKNDSYLSGYNAGIDTTELVYKKKIKPLIDSVRKQNKRIDSILNSFESASVSSFSNHSELKKEVSSE